MYLHFTYMLYVYCLQIWGMYLHTIIGKNANTQTYWANDIIVTNNQTTVKKNESF